MDFLVETINLEEAVRDCLSRHQIRCGPFGKAVEELRPFLDQHPGGDADWQALDDIRRIRNQIVHNAPTLGVLKDPNDEDSSMAVWEAKNGRLIQIADIDQAADDASRLASLVRRL